VGRSPLACHVAAELVVVAEARRTEDQIPHEVFTLWGICPWHAARIANPRFVTRARRRKPAGAARPESMACVGASS
jgi:hypothetical protein